MKQWHAKQFNTKFPINRSTYHLEYKKKMEEHNEMAFKLTEMNTTEGAPRTNHKKFGYTKKS